MPEQIPKIKYPEFLENVDQAAQAAQTNHSSYRRKDYSTGFKEWIKAENEVLAVGIIRDLIEGHGQELDINLQAQMPSEVVASTDYTVVIEHNQYRTQIVRRNEAGEIIYWHRSKSSQLAMRLGNLGTRFVIDQPSQATQHLRTAA